MGACYDIGNSTQTYNGGASIIKPIIPFKRIQDRAITHIHAFSPKSDIITFLQKNSFIPPSGTSLSHK